MMITTAKSKRIGRHLISEIRQSTRRRERTVPDLHVGASPTPLAASCARACAPRGAGRTGRRMLHPGRVERGWPAPLIVLSELEIVALAVHASGDVLYWVPWSLNSPNVRST